MHDAAAVEDPVPSPVRGRLEVDGLGRPELAGRFAEVLRVCLPTGGGLVVTSDPDDIAALATAVPAARIRVTRPG